MHSYLSAVGLSDISKREFSELFYEVCRRPDGHEVCMDSDGNEFVELTYQLAENLGLVFYGHYDEDDNFHQDYYLPYCYGETLSSQSDIEIVKQSDRESYQGICEDTRLGINIIFHLRNVMDYLQRCRGKVSYKGIERRNLYLSGLSTSGIVMLPMAQDKKVLTAIGVGRGDDHASLVAAAHEGDEKAIEALTLEDMQTFQMLSERITREDVYSIVSSTFMPHGIESDKYMVIAEIMDVRNILNQQTMEEIYWLQLRANDVDFDLYINHNDLLGEPAVGRRFKGVVWLQGRVEF